MSAKITIEVNWLDGEEGRNIDDETFKFITDKIKEGYVEGECYQEDPNTKELIRGWWGTTWELILQPEKQYAESRS